MVMDTYKSWDSVPDNLKTKTGLARLGLKPAKDQIPAARKVGGYGPYPLFDISEAIPKRKLSGAQAQALEAARRKAMTTTCCNRFTGTINWHYKGGMCESCYYDWEEEQHQMMLEEAKKEAEAWARDILTDPAAVILDTETTGLEGRIVEISVLHVLTGEVLLDTLINPECPIPSEASRIHGITDEMVQDAPTFAESYPQIEKAINGKRVIIYNASFDVGRLYDDCRRCDLDVLDFKSGCAMMQYAAWYGDYSEYHGSFRWQPLRGGDHRALGDCRACLERVREMAGEGTEPVAGSAGLDVGDSKEDIFLEAGKSNLKIL